MKALFLAATLCLALTFSNNKASAQGSCYADPYQGGAVICPSDPVQQYAAPPPSGGDTIQEAALPPQSRALSPICGAWEGTFTPLDAQTREGQRGGGPHSITVECSGANVSGTSRILSNRQNRIVTPPLERARIDGDTLTYLVRGGYADIDTTLRYSREGPVEYLEGTGRVSNAHGNPLTVSIKMQRRAR